MGMQAGACVLPVDVSYAPALECVSLLIVEKTHQAVISV